jgi:hypothetical protein
MQSHDRESAAMTGRALRENALCALTAAAASLAMAWLGLYGFAWTDYEVEARAPLEALLHGHLAEFLRLAPVYGGSLVLRAPFALLADALGGGELAVYRLVALPCLLAAGALGVWLVSEMRRLQRPPLGRALALALCVANPLTLAALEVGHPEDLLGGALCVAAVLLASRGRALWAGALLGAAIANKEWALLALAPVLLALPERRVRCVACAATVTGAILAPLVLVHAGNFIAETRATSATSSSIFQPWQLWWFLGHHGARVIGTFGRVKPGYRTGPPWTGAISHPLVLAAMLPLAAPLWWRTRTHGRPHTETEATETQATEMEEVEEAEAEAKELRRRSSIFGPAARGRRRRPTPTRAHAREGVDPPPRAHTRARGALFSITHSRSISEREALMLLALLLLVRCMLDTWDTAYYALPFLLALTSCESLGPHGLPVLALGATALAWIDFEWLRTHASPDAQAALFLAWTLPLAVALGVALFAPDAGRALSRLFGTHTGRSAISAPAQG